MLRLFDSDTGQVETIQPGHRRELRVLAVAPALPDPGDPELASLRTFLLPDQLRRTAEGRSLVPTVCEIGLPDQAGTEPLDAEVRAALNLYPPARIAPAGEPVERTVEFAGPGSPPFDVGTGDTGWLAGRDVIRYRAAPAGAVRPGDDGPRRWSELTAAGLDPLALRLVFTQLRYADDAVVTWAALTAAGQALSEWRRSVAEWANSPSAAMPGRYADAVITAFDNDLDTAGALSQLQALAGDRDVAAGAKFETFAAADRLLGLDLARDIGRY